jgi:hypothetical protein
MKKIKPTASQKKQKISELDRAAQRARAARYNLRQEHLTIQHDEAEALWMLKVAAVAVGAALFAAGVLVGYGVWG